MVNLSEITFFATVGLSSGQTAIQFIKHIVDSAPVGEHAESMFTRYPNVPLGAVLNHGCWCSRLGIPGVSGLTDPQLAPVDNIDALCKEWIEARRCITLTDGACSGITNNQYRVNLASIDPLSTNNPVLNCERDVNKNVEKGPCNVATCQVDAKFGELIRAAIGRGNELNFMANANYGACSVDSSILTGADEDLRCDGSAPNVQIIYPGGPVNDDPQEFTRVDQSEGTIADHASVLLESVDLGEVLNHGCWCSRLGTSDNSENRNLGTLDSIDFLCKQWFQARRCITLEGGICNGVGDNSYSYNAARVDPRNQGSQIDNCSRDNWGNSVCGTATCKVDGKFAYDIFEAVIETYGARALFVANTDIDSCDSITPTARGQLMCEGTAPEVKVVEKESNDLPSLGDLL